MSSSKCSAILNLLKHSIVVQKYSREVQTNSQNLYGEVAVNSRDYSGGEGVKPGTNARDPGPKSGTNFYWHQKGTKHANNYMKFTPYIV